MDDSHRLTERRRADTEALCRPARSDRTARQQPLRVDVFADSAPILPDDDHPAHPILDDPRILLIAGGGADGDAVLRPARDRSCVHRVRGDGEHEKRSGPTDGGWTGLAARGPRPA